ncbi:MAG: glycoside hydrolase family 3 N-terminal domain-containing protein [Tannerellaceae bacterium]
MKRFLYFFLLFCIVENLGAQNMLPYQDSKNSIEKRIVDLLSRMTLEEKVDQLNMKTLNALRIDNKGEISDSSLVQLFKGRSIGCLESPFLEHEKVAMYAEAADHYLRTQTRLGIPAIQIAECLHGQMALGATIFPQSIGLGSTWNPNLIKKMASVIAQEASLSGVDQALSPLFDVARDPRYGRVEECYGEDPFLVKQMGVAFVKGMQGEPEITKSKIATGKLACTAKHFIAYSVPEAGINLAPSLVGERTLRELHFYPFEGVVKEANIYSVMPGYHEVDGVPVHASKWLLTDILRKEWGFDGYIFSDYGAIGMLDNFHYTAANKAESALQAITAGVDLEAPSSYAYNELPNLVRSGKLREAVIDSAVVNVLRIKFKLGLFDTPYKKRSDISNLIHTKANVNLAREIAEESIVLLKNENNLLPLKKEQLQSLALIGPNADKVQFGDYSITKNNDYGVTILEGLKTYIGDKFPVNYAEGCGITSLSKDGFAQAIDAANKSDLIVFVAGGTSVIYSGIGWGDQNSKEVNTCGEGYDRNELGLPGVQAELLAELKKTGKPIIMILVNGRPYTIAEEIKSVQSVLEAWYPGEQGGNAIARLLFGEVSPSAKLSMTFPMSVGHIPMYANHKPSAKGFYKQRGTPEKPGRDYVFSSPDPLFCFGHGLSYTTFEYSNLKVDDSFKQSQDSIYVTCKVANVGNMDGAEVVQLYVQDKVSSVTTPVKALKAFEKIYIPQGGVCDVKLGFSKEDLKLWNQEMQKVLEPGEFEIYLGSSVNDIRLQEVFTIK